MKVLDFGLAKLTDPGIRVWLDRSILELSDADALAAMTGRA